MSLSLSVKVTLWSLLLLALAAYSSSSFSLPLGDYFAAALDYDQEFRRVKEEKAIDIYKKGIAAASKKGDLMPLKDMQNRMNQLLHSSP